ncbi:MAG: hypothetical protein NXH71_08330 [Erythrobacteraceae bacterium]|jgi:hypothetical protein|nr:hypothetical protein [Erythrobacteraceae bacterium]
MHHDHPPKIASAKPQDRQRIISAIMRVFATDPIMRFASPTADKYLGPLLEFMTLFGGNAFHRSLRQSIVQNADDRGKWIILTRQIDRLQNPSGFMPADHQIPDAGRPRHRPKAAIAPTHLAAPHS